ncbi:MAG: hypothetical protein ACSHXZ_07335 [Gammaproteobacteria bacterium]
MKDKRSTPTTVAIDPDLKSQAEEQLRKEITLIEHWMKNLEPRSGTDTNATQLNLKYQDMRRSRQDMLDALQKQQS